MPEYRIYLGADHRGFKKKEELFPMLNECHENVIAEDLGAETYDENDDFNDPALAVAQAVLQNKHSFGVLLCGSAHGVCMQANRVKGIRAINADSEASARLGREDDYANVLCLSADQLDVDTMERIVKAFCHARPKLDEHYARRVKRLDEDPVLKGINAGFKLASTQGNEENSEEE